MSEDQEQPAQETATTLAAYPSDPRDGWEPGPPSPRAMLPSVVGGAVIPLGVYYLVRSHVSGDATALAIAGVPAAMWVGIQWLRLRRIDPIGAIILFGFIAGLIVSAALGGNAFVLKVRDSAFTGLFGLSCLASLAFSRPLMFYVGRAMSAGDDPVRREAYDALWEMPQARRVQPAGRRRGEGAGDGARGRGGAVDRCARTRAERRCRRRGGSSR